MAIISPQTAENSAVGNYHRINGAELECSPEHPVPRWRISVGFYASVFARNTRPDLPMWTHHIFVPIADLVAMGLPDPRDQLYDLAMKDPRFAGTIAASDAPAEQ